MQPTERGKRMNSANLRPWQTQALQKALTWLLDTRTDRHFLINAAPGAGKTLCASMIARRLLEAREIERVIVIAPRSPVVGQWAEEFRNVTGRSMTKVTGTHANIDAYGTDLCATWNAVQGLQDAFQYICRTFKTLVICDEHHHAAVEAAWGEKADSAFSEARFVLVLTGTPIRSDKQEPIWLRYDDKGGVRHPEAGTFTLTYGDAVDQGYCRPITFHRHEGHFSVTLPDSDPIAVSGTSAPQLSRKLKKSKGLRQAVDFYRLACTPSYLADATPDPSSYQASMLAWGIEKLNAIRQDIPHAGGLVIAPSIEIAEYMAALLEQLDTQPTAQAKPSEAKPMLVHSSMPNADELIKAFRTSDHRWLVSVAMVSEGVDIKRLRVLVYLPLPQTELAFRQAMGRVVRNLDEEDGSRAYVIMPAHKTFEKYAREVENEMGPALRRVPPRVSVRICSDCGADSPRGLQACPVCDSEFSSTKHVFKTCDSCGGLNPANAQDCQVCRHSFRSAMQVILKEAHRSGAIIRGVVHDEEDVRTGERRGPQIQSDILASQHPELIKMAKGMPAEAWGLLLKILEKK
jgi:superfamily II DNA or RNA helicase